MADYRSPDLADLFQRFQVCMARVDTVSRDRRRGTGSAFHIGDGWFVTAEHVIRDRVFRLVPHEHGRRVAVHRVICSETASDLALVHTDFSLAGYMDRTTIRGRPEEWQVDHFPIAEIYSDWLGTELVLTRYLVMGYPATPEQGRVLVGDAGYVNAVADPPLREHPYFLVSGLPRHGFSGGPVLSEYGFLLGVITDAFGDAAGKERYGYPAAISPEPLWDLLASNDVYPASNAPFSRNTRETHRR